MICSKRIETGKFAAPPLAIEVFEQSKSTATTSEEGMQGKADAPTVETTGKGSLADRVKASAMSSMNTDIHKAVAMDEATLAVHRNAERFDKSAEAMFTYLQIFSACFDALAHGANDVANAVGPFATIYMLYNGGTLGSKQDMNENKYWILGLS